MTNETEPEPLDPDQAMALIDAHEHVVEDRSLRNAALLYLLWGVAWFIGYGALAGGFIDDWLPIGADTAKLIFTLGILIGVIGSFAYGISEGTSVLGPSARAGAIYGAAWAVCFSAYGALSWRLGDLVEDGRGLFMVQSGVAVIIIGGLYVAGAALFDDLVMLVLGLWFVLADIVGLVIGTGGYFLVMSLLGGGGFLLGGLVTLALRRQRLRPARASRR